MYMVHRGDMHMATQRRHAQGYVEETYREKTRTWVHRGDSPRRHAHGHTKERHRR